MKRPSSSSYSSFCWRGEKQVCCRAASWNYWFPLRRNQFWDFGGNPGKNRGKGGQSSLQTKKIKHGTFVSTNQYCRSYRSTPERFGVLQIPYSLQVEVNKPWNNNWVQTCVHINITIPNLISEKLSDIGEREWIGNGGGWGARCYGQALTVLFEVEGLFSGD